jgi:hypothetical protein
LKTNVPIEIANQMKTLFLQFKKFKNHKMMKGFELKSILLFVKIGVYDLECLNLLENVTKKKYKKDCLELAINVLSLPFPEYVQNELAFNEKFYNTLFGIILKEKGKKGIEG